MLRGGTNDIPGLRTPRVRVFNKKVRPGAGEDQPGFLPFQGKLECRLAPDNLAGVLAVANLVSIHIAVGTPRRDFPTAVPRVPGRLCPLNRGKVSHCTPRYL